MFMEMALTLGVVSIVLELWLVYRFSILLEIFERNILAGLAFSLVLSWLLGEAFGAAGMTVLVAAIGSTLVTAIVYRTGALLVIRPVLAMIAR